MYTREIELEKQVLRANPGIPGCFKYAVEQKKRVIIISDMYLPKSVIKDILALNDCGGYAEIYLSSDHLLTKHTGNLFSFAVKDLNIHPQYMLHIGDNYYSGFLMARKNGIHVCRCTKIKQQLFRKIKTAERFQ